jgi:hypothetical protein
MLTLWFATGFFAGGSSGPEEPPPEPPPSTITIGRGSFSAGPSYRPSWDIQPRKKRNREELETLLLTSAI